MNLLFVCSRNRWRSPTAEAIYKNRPDVTVRLAGTAPSARIRLSLKTILWADVIFVMEKKHKERILLQFEDEINDRPIVVLEIPDVYKFMDPELIENIKTKVEFYFFG